MLKTATLAAALAAVALPAMASSDGFVPSNGDAVASLEQYRYVTGADGKLARVAPGVTAPGRVAPPVATTKANGFEYIGGESGWQLIPHKLVWAAGGFAHSNECDHAIRVVKAPTPGELDATRKPYLGS